MEQPVEETGDEKKAFAINGTLFSHHGPKIRTPQESRNAERYYQPGWQLNPQKPTTPPLDNYVDIRQSDQCTVPAFTLEDLGINLRVIYGENGEKPFDFDENFLKDETSKSILFEKKKVYSTFQPGKVVLGDQNALNCLLQFYKREQNRSDLETDFTSSFTQTGIILDENLVSSEKGEYKEETLYCEGQYVVKEELHKGSFGEVAHIKDKKSRRDAVRKKIVTGFRPSEVTTPRDHKNLMKIFAFTIENRNPVIFTEYCGLSMTEFVRDEDKYLLLTEKVKWNVFAQGLSGFAYLDYYGCQHLDVKPDNICLLEERGEIIVKVTDFGSSRTPLDPLQFDCCTPEYMSSEAAQVFFNRFSQKTCIRFPVDEKDVTGKTDVYAWALCILFLYRRKHVMRAFYTDGVDIKIDRQLQLKMLMELATHPECLENVLMVDDCSPEMKTVLKQTLKGDHSERLSAGEAELLMKSLGEKKSLVPVETVIPQKNKEVSHPVCKPRQSLQKTGISTIPKNVLQPENQTEIRMPVKSSTRNALRRKLAPYTRTDSQTECPGPPDTATPTTPCSNSNSYFEQQSKPETPKEKPVGNIPAFLFEI